MSDIPSIPKRVQIQECDFRSPVSESTMFKIGGTVNFILDHYMIMPGTVQAFAGLEADVDPGWLVCDGSAVDRVVYSNLFAKIGTLHGEGDGLTTFNLPDYRGLFLRMVNTTAIGSSGRDPDSGSRTAPNTGGATGDTVGSIQQDEFGTHNHLYGAAGGGGGSAPFFPTPDVSAPPYQSGSGFSGGAETRPKNAYIIYIIKY